MTGLDGHMEGLITAAANRSLLHDRLRPRGETPEERKKNFCDDLSRGLASGVCLSGDNLRLYRAALTRRNIMLKSLGAAYTAVTEWNFVTGTGIDSPLEVGMQWHPVYGVPYWPGASIKGMMRAYALTLEVDATADDISALFGEGDVPIAELLAWTEGGAEGREPGKVDDRQGRAGSLIVFDALPEPHVSIAEDVMTPHYGVWYESSSLADAVGANEAPGDWLNPVPVSFIVVPPGTIFHFGLALRHEDDRLLALAHNWLEQSLQWIGGGAKTAAGYGRFSQLNPCSR